MSALDQFDRALESLLTIKPPGVSGSKVKELTELAGQNVKDNAQFITHLYKHFRLSPASHKLGVLYVVDSISRMYQDQARRHGQDVSTTTDESTFAGGLRHITTVLPSLMNDIIQHGPDEHKEKIRKLLDIWQRSKTFPDDAIQEFRQKLQETSTTPTGTPPPPPLPPPTNKETIAPAQPNPPDAASILSALAAMAKNPPPQQSQTPGAFAAPSLSGQFSNSLNSDPRVRGVAVSPPQSLTTPSALAGLPPQQPPAQNANVLAALTSLLPQSSTQSSLPAIDPQKLAIIQLLLQQGVPLEQVTAILSQTQPAQASQPPFPLSPDRYGRRRDSRSRSRSPPPRSPYRAGSPPRGRGRGRRRESFDSPPPRRRRSPSYDDYRGNRRSPSRSRSPPTRKARSPPRKERSPVRKGLPQIDPQDYKPRYIEWDDSLKPDRIRVLSRTLFVGGVTNRITEDKLRELFSRFGGVQSIIMNQEKRCAFLKMYTREGAINAREGMEQYPTDDTTIRTKYGVGFGPRDCSDYTTGISIIPISRLTEADRKWVVTAEYGGTGGRPLEAGMILEEPDIEIGAGVSSKAISQKIHLRQNQGSGKGGRHQSRDDQQQSWNQPSNEGYNQNQSPAIQPGFPPFMMMPGQPGMFPPGQFPPFMMPPQMQAFFQQQFGGQGQQGFGGQEGMQGNPDQQGNDTQNQ